MTYEDACRDIDPGISALLSALHIDADSIGDECASEATLICIMLQRVAEMLKPLNIAYDPESGELVIPKPPFHIKNILGLILLIAKDNGIPMKPFEDIRWPPGVDWERHDSKAEQLNLHQAEILCAGEESETTALVESHGLQELNSVLYRVFDGDLHDAFYL